MSWNNVRDFLSRPLAVGWQVAFVWIIYLIYLPFNDFQGGNLQHDAVQYWVMAVKFQRHHQSFSLLYYDDPLRGYVGPLMMFPALAFRFSTDCSMLTAAKMLGSAWAAILFGFLIPGLWTSITSRRIAAGRWLLLVLAGFIFWRDFFSFTLTDMPALGTLILSLWLLSRPGLLAWLLAGLSIAATFNMRPVYLVSLLPFLGLAIWWSHRHSPRASGWRWAALIVGMALTLGPQWAINRIHFQEDTPLTLARMTGHKESFYLKQLAWGTRVQLYDGALAHPGALPYADESGVKLFERLKQREYTSYTQYLQIVAQQPVDFFLRYGRHLFNGLDIRHPTPYRLTANSPESLPLKLLNYVLVALALTTIRVKQLRWQHYLVLLALLLPCTAAIPIAIENRFFLPLHLLLLSAVAFLFSPAEWWLRFRSRPAFGVLAALGLILWVAGCWWLSEAVGQTICPGCVQKLLY
ncbi:hypothetical protein SAMN00120144_3246 [Hymenobacter roseosalivarius DSM 11622]|uniref:Glycosyltransferase RgtA/B/C/D-like domain-containing protein n=1 Tax=Hymenobacter roseosalivarius DSM 11622 TaxID=645990 RepID=A0A1W1W4J2_9BACT|nr:hypothetical protein [Hymenobacter roseosalivarius]SMC00433.1 hypothetical protein SAMN00120144_3246 [Hymenobacter roseosalivarius DSM 11622]